MTYAGGPEQGWRRAADGRIELLFSANEVLVRNSENATQVLRLTPAEWTVFIAGVKRGEFD